MTINLRLASKYRQEVDNQAAFSAAASTIDFYDPNALLFLPPGMAEFANMAGLQKLATGKGATIGSGLGALTGTGIFETEEEKQSTSPLSRLAKVAGGAAIGQGAGMGVQAGVGAAKKRFGRVGAKNATSGAIPQPGAPGFAQQRVGEAPQPRRKVNPLDPEYQTIDV